MDVNFGHLPNQEHFILRSLIFDKDSIDHYLDDPNLSVLDMIKQYDVPMTNNIKKKDKNLRCAVCDAKAVGYNFDQISCESCKAFFRRNALRNINELRCRFSGSCNITIETRRHCPYCRIKKCLAVGMRKEWIRSEEEKQMKRLQKERNPRRRHIQEKIETPTIMPFKSSNNSIILGSEDRIRLSNILNCYNQYTSDPCMAAYRPRQTILLLRVDELYNRKKNTCINLISYFKHLPELKILNLDDQVLLIKQNIRLLLPLNCAIFRARLNAKVRNPGIKTIGCKDNIDIQYMLRSLGDIYFQFTTYDPIIIKLFIVVLFFTTDALTTKSIYNPGQYKQLDEIKQIQSSYMELLWLYMVDKYGEEDAVHLLTKMITRYLHVQMTIDQVDSIIEVNNDIQNVDSLMQTMLQLT